MKEQFDEKQIKLGRIIFISGAALIVFYFFIQNIGVFIAAVKTLVGILMPFIYGMVLAYLLCPAYNLVTRTAYKRLKTKIQPAKAFKWSKVVATIASFLLLFIIVGSFFALIVPQLVISITTLVEQMPGRLDDLEVWVDSVLGKGRYPQLVETLNKSIQNASDNVMDLIQEHVMPGVGSYLSAISQGLLVTLRTLLNIIIGVIVCAYVLNSKERFKAQGRKMIQALFSRTTSEEIFNFANYTDTTFGSFINGKVIDSIIIGILCYLTMQLLGIPYAALCATIVGVTNIIPFFGPFIGAIPSFIFICIADPVKAGIFLVLILVLQQVDGNIIGPKILGDRMGLASFWVMFAIILFGGLFGFLGMVVGVPVFAVFYYYLGRIIRGRLKKKGLPEDTEEYLEYNKYDIDRKDV